MNSKSTNDPLKRFKEYTNSAIRPAFAGGEHIWLAQEALKKACIQLQLEVSDFSPIQRSEDDEEFTYGELVALSGDFYATPDELFNETTSIFDQIYEENDLSDLRKIFQEELDWIQQQLTNSSAEAGYPSNALSYWWNAKNYLELALDNSDHFGWHNAKAYCTYHTKALQLAVESKLLYEQQNSIEAEKVWRKARFTNAFADHFLTDGFAAGHIRVPRAQIRTWARRIGRSEKFAASLSKLLHDQDGHIKTFHNNGEKKADNDGLRVTNSLENSWYTHCDGQLFIVEENKTLTDQPISAVQKSLVELLETHSSGQIPNGVYAATKHLPFPHKDINPFHKKFTADMSDSEIEELVASVDWYSKIKWLGPSLSAGNVLELFYALPKIMECFRADVQADLDNNQELKKRLPELYCTAFKNIA